MIYSQQNQIYMSDNISFKRDEIIPFLKQLSRIFTYVSLLDVAAGKKYITAENGELKTVSVGEDASNPDSITMRALKGKTQINKFEFLKQNIFFVTAKYILIESREYVLESVSMINNDSLFKDFGKNDFIRLFNEYSDENYRDPLTTCYNRRYYDDQKQALQKATAIARIDLDLYRQIRETYGPMVTEAALKTLGITIQKCVRKTDSVIYLEGEKFLIFFYGMKQPVLKGKLEEIRSAIQRTVIPQHPAVKLSISIGGYFSEKISINDITKAQKLLDEARLHLNYVVVN